MKKGFRLVCVVILIILSTLACSRFQITVIRGSGELATEARVIQNIRQVIVDDGIGFILTQTGEESIEIEAEVNILPYVETNQEGEVLKIGFQQRAGELIITTKPVIIRLSVKDIYRLEISGGGNLDCKGLHVERLAVDVSGDGQARMMNLDAETLELSLSGSSDAIVSGAASSIRLDMSGGGNLNARELVSANATATMSGGGKAVLWVTGSLDADLSGGSRIRYLGTPLIDQITSGGSNVKPLNE
jgi:hypothetical protein